MAKTIRFAGLVLVATLAIPQPAQASAWLIPLITDFISTLAEEASRLTDKTDELSAYELSRGIPERAVAATMSPPQGREVRMNKKTMRLAPGSKILDTNSRIVLPNRIPEKVPVRYTLDYYGNVHTIWLLSELEY